MEDKSNPVPQGGNGYNKRELLAELLRVKNELMKEREDHLKDLKSHYLFLVDLHLCKNTIGAGEILRQSPPVSNN